MPLHPPYPLPERILIFGPPGAGKTTAYLDIARWASRTKSDAQFFIADSDAAVPRMLTSYPEILDRVHLTPVLDWPDYMAFQKLVMSQAREQDWVIVDFISSAWTTIQEYFVDEVFDHDIGDYFLQARKSMKPGASSLGALEGWTDWQVINKLYTSFTKPLIFRGRFNLLCTAMSESLSSDKKPTEDRQTRQLLLPFGVKPMGQKHLAFQFHTCLLAQHVQHNNIHHRTLTTVGKDRERQEIAGLTISSFTRDYLKDIAGWSLV